jgi:hypothetical protein
MNYVPLLPGLFALFAISAIAKDTTKVAYMAGTLPLPQNTTGHFDPRDQREFVVTWSGGKRITRVPYNRVVFTEIGSYNSRLTLDWLVGDSGASIQFLTLIYRDDANRTEILELEVPFRSSGVFELIKTRTGMDAHQPPSEVTSLAPTLASSLDNTEHEAKVWSTTLPGAHSGAKALLRATNGNGLEVRISKQDLRIDYGSIQSFEFGQKVGSRVGTAILLSAVTLDPWPMVLMRKRVRRFLTVGFVENGTPQALVVELPKYSSRALILELELRSGKKVEYESPKAASNVYG